MSEKPLVLALHAVLELAALVAVGYWGWVANDGAERLVWAFAVPLLIGTVWAVFRAEDDGGDPIVTVPGPARLVLELVLMGGTAVLLHLAGQPAWALAFLAFVVLVYALQHDRIGRLLGRRSRTSESAQASVLQAPGKAHEPGDGPMTYGTSGASGQTTVGEEAKGQEHTHPAQVHAHDHYHVTHHHTGGPLGEFDHRAHYHTHEHNHAPLVHGHEHDNDDEDHGKEAHVHDHNEPAGDGS